MGGVVHDHEFMHSRTIRLQIVRSIIKCSAIEAFESIGVHEILQAVVEQARWTTHQGRQRAVVNTFRLATGPRRTRLVNTAFLHCEINCDHHDLQEQEESMHVLVIPQKAQLP